MAKTPQQERDETVDVGELIPSLCRALRVPGPSGLLAAIQAMELERNEMAMEIAKFRAPAAQPTIRATDVAHASLRLIDRAVADAIPVHIAARDTHNEDGDRLLIWRTYSPAADIVPVRVTIISQLSGTQYSSEAHLKVFGCIESLSENEPMFSIPDHEARGPEAYMNAIRAVGAALLGQVGMIVGALKDTSRKNVRRVREIEPAMRFLAKDGAGLIRPIPHEYQSLADRFGPRALFAAMDAMKAGQALGVVTKDGKEAIGVTGDVCRL